MIGLQSPSMTSLLPWKIFIIFLIIPPCGEQYSTLLNDRLPKHPCLQIWKEKQVVGQLNENISHSVKVLSSRSVPS